MRCSVAPYAGAWIETDRSITDIYTDNVAPYAGAWIETLHLGSGHSISLVAPYAGAWIETGGSVSIAGGSIGRALRRRVD